MSVQIGAPHVEHLKYVLAKQNGDSRYMFQILLNGRHVSPLAPHIDTHSLPDNALYILNVTQESDFADDLIDSYGIDFEIETTIPLAPTDDANDVYGNYLLQNSTTWVHGGPTDRERMLARARGVLQRMGIVDVSDETILERFETETKRRSAQNRDLLRRNQEMHYALRNVLHTDFSMSRSEFGARSVRQMQIRVYRHRDVRIALEVRNGSSIGQARAMWACTRLDGVTQQDRRVAILYAAPLQFRNCFLQRESPPLSQFADVLRNFPWLPMAESCRAAIGWFDWHRATDNPINVLDKWASMSAYERGRLVEHRAQAAEDAMRRRLDQSADMMPTSTSPAPSITSPDDSEEEDEDSPAPSITSPMESVEDEGDEEDEKEDDEEEEEEEDDEDDEDDEEEDEDDEEEEEDEEEWVDEDEEEEWPRAT